MCFAFHQVSLTVEGSTMSGSLQRRKKSKRKWKRLWFLLKDKVLYTFTAREVRGHRVSHTSPKTLTHTLLITEAFPYTLCLSFFPLHIWPLQHRTIYHSHFHCSTLYVTNEGILCALSVPLVALFFSKHEILVIHILPLTASLVFLTCVPVFDVFTLVSSG